MDNEDEVENLSELADWQKHLIDERLSEYYQNPTDMMDFDETIDDIEKSL
jgi:hypothetical protein